VETYATGELCLALDKKPDVIILTSIWTELIKRNEWIETLDKIKEFDPDIPVVMLSLG
jgi:DNA-binding NarL/FixJ family response regulator